MRACRPRKRLRGRNVHTLQLKPQDESVNAFVVRNREAEQDLCGPLAGLSVAVKDNICTSGLGTTCSSVMLQKFQSKYNATVVDLIQQAGAHITGKTNCDEFGMGSLNVYTIHGPVLNPFQAKSDSSPWTLREKRSAGGSSGGSAAAVASRQCFAALSTDTGGSTRLPASYCGIVGLKPSYGLLSRWGVISFADSLDTVGIMASRVRDVRRVFGQHNRSLQQAADIIVLDVVSHFDEKDPTSVPVDLRVEAQEECSAQIAASVTNSMNSLRDLRIGIPQEYFPAEVEPSLLKPCRRILARLKDLGAALVPVSLPSTRYALSAYYVLASAEASSNLARYDGSRYGTFVSPPIGVDKSRAADVYAHSRSHGFGREVQKRILLGTYALTADAFDNYFLQAQRLRRLVRTDFDHVFRARNVLSGTYNKDADSCAGVDVLIHPSAIRTAPRLSEVMAASNLETYVQDALTAPASLAGLPALSVPAGQGADGWPVGISVVGQWAWDEMVLKVGEAIENICAEIDS